MSKCKCKLSIRVLGDGCRYCQPQTYIDNLHETIEECELVDEFMDCYDHWDAFEEWKGRSQQ